MSFIQPEGGVFHHIVSFIILFLRSTFREHKRDAIDAVITDEENQRKKNN